MSKVDQVRAFMRLIGPKWSVEIITALTHGPRRWTELETTLTRISGQVVYSRPLSIALRNLQGKGYIVRTDDKHGAVYRLTRKGRELDTVLDEIAGWAERHSDSLDL